MFPCTLYVLRTLNRGFSCPVRLCYANLKAYTKEQLKLKQNLKSQSRPTKINSQDLPLTVAKHLGIDLDKQSELNAVQNESKPAVDTRELESDPPDSTPYPPINNQLGSVPEALLRAYNDSDPSLPALAATCNGCGSTLHCKTPGEPGFIPRTVYQRLQLIENRKLTRRGYARTPNAVICVRCTVLQNHVHAMHTSFSASIYEGLVLSQLKNDPDATILLVADMLNLPHSLIPKLGNELGRHRYILVGNKVDELPIGEQHDREHWKQALICAARERSSIDEGSIIHLSLTSALTGYGVNQLIDFLLSRKFNSAAPIYILGSTNVGKSSLFNRLLLSDLCKSEARETIHRATISEWPGTTAGLLKFPMVLMNSAKRGLREEAKYNAHLSASDNKDSEYIASCGFRYLKAQPIVKSDQLSYTPLTAAAEKARSSVPNLFNIPTYTRNSDVTEANDLDLVRLQQVYLPKDLHVDTGSWAGDRGYRLLTTFLDPRHFNDRAWCFDTPGFICPDQTLNYLSATELRKLDKRSTAPAFSKHQKTDAGGDSKRMLIVPRTFVMRPGLALLLGHLGRLDLVQAPGPVYFTTFSTVPVHIIEQSEFEQYVYEHAKSLGPGREQTQNGPCGPLPPLEGRVLDAIDPQLSADSSTVDVVLSGAGWISVVGISKQHSPEASEDGKSDAPSGQIHLCAWTPGGLGISVRKPPLVPTAVHRRGKRLYMMREFGGLQ